MSEANENAEAAAMDALQVIISALSRLDERSRERVLQSVATFFGTTVSGPVQRETTISKRPGLGGLDFSADNAPSPKDFMMEKQPRTDVERIACLAFYLTYYRELPHFKTLDLAKLNTEAAQPKFSNAGFSTTNALNMGYLATAINGHRQLSAAGEQFVRALPDREAAKAAMAAARPRRKGRRRTNRDTDEQ
jgi:hypothetical protein